MPLLRARAESTLEAAASHAPSESQATIASDRSRKNDVLTLWPELANAKYLLAAYHAAPAVKATPTPATTPMRSRDIILPNCPQREAPYL